VLLAEMPPLDVVLQGQEPGSNVRFTLPSPLALSNPRISDTWKDAIRACLDASQDYLDLTLKRFGAHRRVRPIASAATSLRDDLTACGRALAGLLPRLAAAEQGGDANGAPARGSRRRRGASNGGPADNGRALRRGLADDDSASHRSLASDRNGGRGAPGGGSHRAGIGAHRNDGRCNQKCCCES
jgi:hypothetical protein